MDALELAIELLEEAREVNAQYLEEERAFFETQTTLDIELLFPHLKRVDGRWALREGGVK